MGGKLTFGMQPIKMLNEPPSTRETLLPGWDSKGTRIAPRWLLIVAYLALIGAGPLMNVGLRAQADAPVRHETKDRLSTERMEALVAGPMALVRAGDVAGGERAFETLLDDASRRHGTGSAEAADLLMSFGIMVYTEGLIPSTGSEADDRLSARSLPYLRRSVEAYRRAFVPNHPLVAVALHSLGHALIDLAAGDPPAEAEAALEETYRIRLEALGPANPETLAALANVADIKGLPGRTGRDRTRVAEVVIMYRQGLAQARRPMGAFPEEQPRFWYTRLARMYVHNGQAAAALQVVTEAERMSGAWACEDMPMLVAEIAHLLEQQGFATEAEALGRRDPIDRLMACFDRQADPVIATS